MMTRNTSDQIQMVLVNWDDLIPKDHLLRKINETIDFSFIYDMVEHLYSPVGRPSIDPVILFKMMLIGYLYGIPSERRLEEEVKLNLAYRWFVGLQINDPVPDHSTFSQNRRRRFRDASVFQGIFDHFVSLCVEKGLVTGELVVTDSTHIQADVAVGKNETTICVTQSPREYLKLLDDEARSLDEKLKRTSKSEDSDDDDRDGDGGITAPEDTDRSNKKDNRANNPLTAPKTRKVKINRTDPDARWMNRPGKARGYYYLSHQIIDTKYGIISDVHTTTGNVNDHLFTGSRLRRIEETFDLDIQHVAGDAGYDEFSVHRELNELDIKGFIPRKIKRGPAKTFRQDQFEYVSEGDFYRCPAGEQLPFKYVSRTNGLKVYASNVDDCRGCSLRTQCIPPSARVKTVSRHIFQSKADITHSWIGTAAYKAAQRLRKIWCEGTFALQKRLHNLGRARMRGLERVHEQSLMAAIAVNLKRMMKSGLVEALR